MQALQMLLIFLFFLLGSTLLFGCSGASIESGDLHKFKRKEIYELNAAMREEIEELYPSVQHRLIERYINQLGQKLLVYNLGMPNYLYEFRVLRTKDVNSFSLPGGSVYISLSLLALAKGEGEILGALAHELAHQKAQHPLHMWKKRTMGVISTFTPSSFSGDYFRSRYFGKNGFLYYDSKMEYEADKIATELLYKAGFDPKSLLSYLEALHRLQEKDPESLSLWLSVHPDTEDRIKRLKVCLHSRFFSRPLVKSKSSGTFKRVKALLRSAVRLKKMEKEE